MKPLNLSTSVRIVRIPHNYVVEHARIAKTGKYANQPRWEAHRYYATLEQAARHALLDRVGDFDVEGCTALIEAIKSLESAVVAMCRRFEDAA